MLLSEVRRAELMTDHILVVHRRGSKLALVDMVTSHLVVTLLRRAVSLSGIRGRGPLVHGEHDGGTLLDSEVFKGLARSGIKPDVRGSL